MTTWFADTSYYVAICNPRDALSPRAFSLMRGFAGKIVTTEFVLIEVANFFSGAGVRQVFTNLVTQIRWDPTAEIIPASRDLFEQVLDLFAARPDKDWSLTDCTSFVVMNDNRIAKALTADHHFEQAGFIALLK